MRTGRQRGALPLAADGTVLQATLVRRDVCLCDGEGGEQRFRSGSAELLREDIFREVGVCRSPCTSHRKDYLNLRVPLTYPARNVSVLMNLVNRAPPSSYHIQTTARIVVSVSPVRARMGSTCICRLAGQMLYRHLL